MQPYLIHHVFIASLAEASLIIGATQRDPTPDIIFDKFDNSTKFDKSDKLEV